MLKKNVLLILSGRNLKWGIGISKSKTIVIINIQMLRFYCDVSHMYVLGYSLKYLIFG